MVHLIRSTNLSRGPVYSLACLVPDNNGVYGIITLYDSLSQNFPLLIILSHAGLHPFRSPLLRVSLVWFLFLSVLRCFSSQGSLRYPMYSDNDDAYMRRVSPFRHQRITGHLPPPRRFSQAITSFIASNCQGILCLRFLLWPHHPIILISLDVAFTTSMPIN